MNKHSIQEELYLKHPKLPIDIAKKLSTYIWGLGRKYPTVDFVELVSLSVVAVGKGMSKFDETKGIMYPYLKNAIRYKLQEYFRGLAKQPELPVDYHDLTEVDLSGMLDEEILKLYKKTYHET